MTDSPAERAAFGERIRLQLRARYPQLTVDVEPVRFALHVRGPSVDITLPLAPLHHAVLRDPARTPVRISEFVAGVEHQLTPRLATTVAPARLVWCVRNRRSLSGLTRVSDLLTAELPADLVAFVAEELPGSIMRGVPRDEWEAAGLDDDAVRRTAANNTDRRFAPLARHVRDADRVPRDGWRMSADPLFQSSIVMAAGLLAALAERTQGDVFIGLPDRGVALAVPAGEQAMIGFAQRLMREHRDAMNPVSSAVLRSDGTAIREEPRRRRRVATAVMPWLQE